MRPIRLILFALSLLPALLAGCGGGGGGSKSVGTRTINISIRWPDATQKSAHKATGRVVPSGVRFVTVEAWSGSNLLGTLHFDQNDPNNHIDKTPGQFQLPETGVTFYAYAYKDPGNGIAPDANYRTNPVNGSLCNYNSTTKIYTNLARTDVHPLAQATYLVDVATFAQPAVTFTLNNTVQSLQPNYNKTNNTTGGTDTLTYSLDALTVTPDTVVTALASDGAVVMVDPTHFTWDYDPTDPKSALTQRLVTVAGNKSSVTLNATGTARLRVTYDEVNNGTVIDPSTAPAPVQAPYQAYVSLTITPHSTQPTITATATQVPVYAKSLKLTVLQLPIPDPTKTLPDPGYPADALEPTGLPGDPLTKVVAIGAPLTLPVSATGRQLRLTLEAWSGTNGTGALLASQQVDTTTFTGANFTQAFNALVQKTTLQLTPPNPTITLVNPLPTMPASAPGPNVVALQIQAVLTDGSHPITVDPALFTITPALNSNATNVVTSRYVDGQGTPYLLITAKGPTGGTPATITVTDPQSMLTTTTLVTTAYTTNSSGTVTIH